jgi:ketosteroid isomerase-like protein
MSNEANKQLITKLFDNISNGKVAAAMELLTDDCVWTIPGKPDRLPVAGPKKKAELTGLFQQLLVDAIPKGLHLKANDFISEGDRVAVEAESIGDVANGRVYQNHYHFMFNIRGGKISKVNEYCDTLHVKETFLDA